MGSSRATAAPIYEWLRRQTGGGTEVSKDQIRAAQRDLGPYCTLRPDASVAYVFSHPGPYYLPFSTQGWDFFVEQHVDALSKVGIGPGAVADIAVSFHLVVAGLVFDQALRRLGTTVVPGGSGQHLEHANLIESLSIDWLIGFPSFLEQILGATKGVRLAGILAVGERVGPTSSLREATDTLRQTYSTGETGPVAASCGWGNLHALECAEIELRVPLPAEVHGATSPDIGEIVVTVPARPDGPITYRTGDYSAWIDCPCGLGVAFEPPQRPDSSTHRSRGIFYTDEDVREVLESIGYDGNFEVVVNDISARPALVLHQHNAELQLGSTALVDVLADRLRLRFDIVIVEP